MANMTGGESFHAIDVATMDAALQSIEQRHQKISDNRPDNNSAPRLHQPLYHWPLLTALLLLILMTLLPYRGGKKPSDAQLIS